jgi:hypothetical protein
MSAFRSFILRAYGPHFVLLGTIIVHSLLQEYELPAYVQWIRSTAAVAFAVAIPGSWIMSCVLVGHRFITFGWLSSVVAIMKNWWWLINTPMTEREHAATRGQATPGCLVIIAGALAIYIVAISLDRAPISFWSLNIIVLTVALIASGAYRRFVNETWPHLGYASRKARSAVKHLYDKHAPSLHATCPPVLFNAELEARIPPKAPDEQAWKAARDMMDQLLRLLPPKEIPKTQRPSINPEDLEFT